MKVFIKNKLISWGGSSHVLDESGQPVFKVKGKIFTFTKKKKMYDMQDKLLYTIRNKFWVGFCHKTIVIDAEGNKVATVKKGKWSFNNDYKILDTENEMSIDGKFFSLSSHIMKNGQPVATITRDFSLIRDSFTLEAEEDIEFYTALVIALDNVKDKEEKD